VYRVRIPGSPGCAPNRFATAGVIGTGEWYAPQGEDLDAEYGRGLAIVAALADMLGHDITASGQTVWAEAGWTDTAGPRQPTFAGPS
jgi:hypothetical protein